MNYSISQRIWLQSGIALFAILLYQLFPEFTEQSRYILLALVILLIGMPHGALDHYIDGNLENWDPKSFNMWFYGWYLAAIAVYTVFWFLFPFLSFMFFLLITLYHFGQADAERFELSGISKWAIHLGRGFTVVGLIVFGDLAYASGIIEAVTQISVLDRVNQVADPVQIKWIIAGFYPSIFLLVWIFNKKRIKTPLPFFVDSLIVPALFIFSDPVWAFSIYFGLWHSYNHALVMLRYLNSKVERATFSWFFKESFLFSLLCYLAILFTYNMLNAFGNEALMVSLLFVVIAVLTLPHMLVVEKLYSRWDK